MLAVQVQYVWLIVKEDQSPVLHGMWSSSELWCGVACLVHGWFFDSLPPFSSFLMAGERLVLPKGQFFAALVLGSEEDNKR